MESEVTSTLNIFRGWNASPCFSNKALDKSFNPIIGDTTIADPVKCYILFSFICIYAFFSVFYLKNLKLKKLRHHKTKYDIPVFVSCKEDSGGYYYKI